MALGVKGLKTTGIKHLQWFVLPKSLKQCPVGDGKAHGHQCHKVTPDPCITAVIIQTEECDVNVRCTA